MCTIDKEGKMPEVQTALEFTIASFATFAEAVEMQLSEAVDQGTTLDRTNPAPSLFTAAGEINDVILPPVVLILSQRLGVPSWRGSSCAQNL